MTAPHRLAAGEVLAFALVALIWGSTWLVIKDQLTFAPAGWSLVWRFAMAAAGMFAAAIARREPLRPGRRQIGFAALVGACQFAGSYQLVYASEKYLTSGLVAVIFALLLVPNAVLSRLMLGTKVSGRFIAGSAVAMAGIALLMRNEVLAAPPQASVPLGLAMALLAVLMASVSNVLQATPTARRLPKMATLGWAMLIGAGLDAVAALVTTGAPPLVPSARYWLGAAYLGLVGTALAFPIYFALIRSWGAGRAGYNGVVVPVVAMALSTVFEAYRWSALAVLGSGLALAGLLIAISGRSAASPSRNEG